MATPPQMVQLVKLVGADGESGYVACRIETSPTRTVGLSGGGGNDLVVSLTREDYEDLGGEESVGLPIGPGVRASVAFGFDPGAVIELGGYWVRHVAPQKYGVPQGGEPEDAAFQEYAMTLSPLPTRWQDGRSGYLWNNVLNPVTANGTAPEEADPLRKENSDLLGILQAYLPFTLGDIPESVDEYEPPSPLDWTAGRAIPELESLLARIGHAPVFSLDGETVEIVRLSRAGEAIAFPDPFPEGAEPYELTRHASTRASRLLLTSGRTRSVIVTMRDATALEWVWFDDRTGQWLNATQTAALYPSETPPDSISAFRAGPKAGDRPAEEFARLFRALRVPASHTPRVGNLVAVSRPSSVTLTEWEASVDLASSPAVAYGSFAEPVDAGQWEQRTDATLRGVRIDASNRVFVLPHPLVKISGSEESGSLGDVEAIEAGDVAIVFAHEADEEAIFPADNFYMRLFSAEIEEGEEEEEDELVITSEGDPEAIQAALSIDKDLLVIEAPFLRRVGTDTPGPTVTWLNDEELDLAAISLARARIAAGLAESGIITFAGFRSFAPGDWGGSITSVSWDLARASTTVTLNQHEVPLAAYDAAEAAAGRSFAAGLSRFVLPGASAAMSDVRGGSGPGDAGVASGAAGAGSGGGLDQATTSRARGAERTNASPALAGAPTPTPRDFDAREFLAVITASSAIGANRWVYSFSECALSAAGTFVPSAGGRASGKSVKALNLAEGMNDGSGVEGNGVDRANLPEGFEMRPIPVGRHVLMRGPFVGESGAQWYLFDAVNADDGECAPEEEPME